MERNMSGVAFSVINELRLEGKLCDVTLKVDDVEFNAHKNILCGCSSYFRALFTSTWHTQDRRVYSFPEVSPAIMNEIIKYAYTRTLDITEDNVEELLVVADQFCILGIVCACCTFLEKQLCLDNCIGIYKFAEIYACQELCQQAYLYILHHFEEIVKTSSQEFLELSPVQLGDLMEKHELSVTREEVVFEATMRWITHSSSERMVHLGQLLSKIRMGLMDGEYFLNNVKNNPLVCENPECRPIILNTLKALYDLNMNGLRTTHFLKPLTCPRLPYSVLLAVGGWSGSDPTNVIEAYDSRANSWVTVPCALESPRAYHGTAYLKGFVYVIGGYDSVEYFSSVQKFNPLTCTWQQVAPMHSRRCYVSVAVLDGCIYAMGGFDGYRRLRTAECYEPETNQWTLIPQMHQQRSDASATTLHGRVYICGGFNGSECLFTAEYFNPATNQWTLMEPMQSRRSGVGVVAFKECIYAIGGFDGNVRLQSGEAYNPRINSWTSISPMFHPRSNFGIGVVEDKLFVVGGFNGFITTFNAEYHDEKINEWYDVQDMQVYRSALSCCVISGLPNVDHYTRPRSAQEGNAVAMTTAGPESLSNT